MAVPLPQNCPVLKQPVWESKLQRINRIASFAGISLVSQVRAPHRLLSAVANFTLSKKEIKYK